MILASTANDLFWMARYVERAESIARTLAAAGALWVGSPGFSPPAEEIVVTSGAQHAMLVAIAR